MKICKRYIIFLLSLVFLAGCGGKEPVVEENVSVIDWKTDGFAVSEEITEEQGLWVKSHIAWSHESVQWQEENQEANPIIEAGVWGDQIYRFYSIIENSEIVPVKGILECYDTSAMEESVMELSPEQMGLGSSSFSFVTDMDMTGEMTGALQVVGYNYDETGQFTQERNCRVWFGQEGEVQQTELLPIYLEKGISKESYKTIILSGDCICDGAGNSYARSGDNTNPYMCLYIMDKEGKLLMEWKGTEQEEIREPVKTPEGELIFPVCSREDGCTRMIWFSVEDGQPHILASVPDKGFVQLYGMQGNVLYYENDRGIVRWDVESGERQLIFSFSENGVSRIYDTMLVLQEGKAPILRTYGKVNEVWEDWLIELSEEPVERAEAIRIVSLEGSSLRVKNCVSVCSRKNPDYAYSYEEAEEKNRADFRTRIMAEMAAGGGPDILYVSREDMELMQSQGLLLDMRSLLPKETVDKVLPGVIELGTVEGTLVGLAPEVSAISLLVGKDVCSQDSWTLDEVLELMESGQLEGKLMDGPYYHASRIALTLLIQYCLEDSFLIDWEKRESHFEDERFLRLVEYMGGYNEAQMEESEDVRTLGGGSLMVLSGIGFLHDAGDFLGARAVEESHYIGYPTENGSGSYLETDGLLVVNRNLSDRQAVAAYLECLLEDEVQDIDDVGVGLPVIPLRTDNILYLPEEGTARWHGREILYYSDGTTSIQEVNAFLEQCVPAPRRYPMLEDIIGEEAAAYYAGDRTAEEVAANIDNRIQTYLNEGG